MIEENKKQINDFSNIKTDEIFDEFVNELELKEVSKNKIIERGDVQCE